jgi:hypothetical protein
MVDTIIGVAIGTVLGGTILVAITVCCWKPLTKFFTEKTIELMEETES